MKRRILIAAGSFLVLLFCFLVWFDWKFSMDIIEPYEINDPSLEKHLLIATQGSEFKDKITDNITNDLKNKQVYISVIDVTTINEIKVGDWDAIVIMHTWEIWEPQVDAETFLKSKYEANKMIIFATSGDGGNMIEGIDGISGASIMDDVPKRTNQLLSEINRILFP